MFVANRGDPRGQAQAALESEQRVVPQSALRRGQCLERPGSYVVAHELDFAEHRRQFAGRVARKSRLERLQVRDGVVHDGCEDRLPGCFPAWQVREPKSAAEQLDEEQVVPADHALQEDSNLAHGRQSIETAAEVDHRLETGHVSYSFVSSVELQLGVDQNGHGGEDFIRGPGSRGQVLVDKLNRLDFVLKDPRIFLQKDL